METNDRTVEDNQQGRDLAEEGGGHGQEPPSNTTDRNTPEEIHDDRVFSFRNGIRQ